MKYFAHHCNNQSTHHTKTFDMAQFLNVFVEASISVAMGLLYRDASHQSDFLCKRTSIRRPIVSNTFERSSTFFIAITTLVISCLISAEMQSTPFRKMPTIVLRTLEIDLPLAQFEVPLTLWLHSP